jgi:hypothetical protein
MRALQLGVLLCALVAALPASGQIYRWVDDRGVVNYSNKPPADVSAVRIDRQESRLSIIPTAPRGIPTYAPTPARLLPSPVFPSNVDRATVSALGGALEWRERCFAERRVDCTNPTAATDDFGIAYPPVSLSVPPRQPGQ